MPQVFINSEGVEVEAYTAEEVAEINAAKESAAKELEEARQALAAKTDDIVKMKQGFKKFSEYSEEEKAKMSEEQRSTFAQLEELRTARQKDQEAAKEAMFLAAAKNDPVVLEKIKEKYDMVQLPEGSLDEVRYRLNAVTSWAYAELGMIDRKPNPIASVIGIGESPRINNNDEKRFADTPEGEALAKKIFPNL